MIGNGPHRQLRFATGTCEIRMKHKYCQRVNICVGQPQDGKPEQTENSNSNSTTTAAATVTVQESDNWLDDPLVLGTLSFWYSSQELFTEEELQDENHDELEMNDDDDMPNCILYKVAVEYRSLPPTANKMAVEAEELSMLSFGGSVDDAVKYGALASLHDENAKYVMEICSPVSVTAVPSQQSLLLDADLAGQVFIDGRYVTTWGRDCKIGSHVEALFGLDLNSIPVWHGRIVDYNVMMQVYSLLWQDLLVDSRLMGLDLANMLLSRLMYGKDETEVYDDDDDNIDTSQDTLESQIFSSSKYDPVGICPKALATRFANEFGKLAIPVLEDDVHVVKRLLGHRTPVVVPPRLMSVLMRGGYFGLGAITTWFTDGIVVVRPPQDDHEKLIVDAVQLLIDVGVDDVTTEQMVFAKIDDQIPNGISTCVVITRLSSNTI
ncbi:hypothetical protein MHU86_8259 [Fragilaria crotonensis]|nr:hypothetical protein MHU86_8259 [Fragilaria crotonensis]